MIHRLSDFSDLAGYDLPFPLIRPEKLKYRDISLRIDDEKWTTLRFIVKYKGKTFRVKEFFLDWFFTGFPKSLLKDFSSTYSSVRDITVHGFRIFCGKNYRRNDSASAYIYGTQVEIDSAEESDLDDFEAIFLDMLKDLPDPGKLSHMQFPERSHFARGYRSTWYEEERISRLNWYRTPRDMFQMPGHSVRACGIGLLKRNPMEQIILILEENQWKNVIWIESVEKNTELEHAFYRIRTGDGFYDFSSSADDRNMTLIFRRNSGPGIVRMETGDRIFTVGFSPGFSLEDMTYVTENMGALELFIERTADRSIHEME